MTAFDRSGLACAILAGGASRRFGGEKPLALLHGRTLLEWAVAALSRFGAPLAVSARKGSETESFCQAKGWPVLHDAQALPAGALDGVCASLAWTHVIGKPWLLSLPCDVPLLPEKYFERLFAAAGTQGSYAQSPKGIESLCALWPGAALSFLQVVAKKPDQPSLQQCLKDIGANAVTFDAPFLNANTREELAEIEARTALRDGTLLLKG